MTHTLSSIIDLTNAPTPPRWFEFLLEPGRLQHHLETNGCDPSPIQLINLFFRNIPNLETTSNIAPINSIATGSSNQANAGQNTANAASGSIHVLSSSSGSTSSPSTNTSSSSADDQSSSTGEPGTKACNGATNGNSNETTSNKNGNSTNGTNSKPNNVEHSDKAYNDLVEPSFDDVLIPPDSYEAKYRLRKAYALRTLAVKVASFLKWDLDRICNGLDIPTQYKLMQALMAACSHDSCPPEVKKFATVLHCHWFIRSAMTYRLSTLQPQSSSTTIIYLSPLQQQQQTADNLALMSMGELFSHLNKRYRDCSDDLHAHIWELAKNNGKVANSAKKLKTSSHPFRKAILSRPKMECFDSRDEQYNDWKQSETIDPFEMMEAACYDLGRFLFFEENYSLAEETFEIIRESSSKYPLLDEYLQSASDILASNDKQRSIHETSADDELDLESCDILSSEVRAKRKQTEKYLFGCMTQYSQGERKESDDVAMNIDIKISAKKDVDLRFAQQADNAWYLTVPADLQQQQLLEIGKGDMMMSQGDFKQAMGCFVGALIIMTDYFRVFSKGYTDEEACITRMIQCSISLSCFTQAVALCQMSKHLNYTIAFKQLNERICNDCCDDIYECIWNVTLLEYIINLHARRGEVERRTKVIQLLGQLELNENNPEEVLREAEHVRRGKFFRIMSNKYL